MDDMISRAAAISEINEYFQGLDLCISEPDLKLDGYKNGLQVAIQELKALPAVDAAPIIRCASCKWWNGNALGAAHRCAALHISTTGEFFCAAAERKTNAFADQSGTEYADNPTV